ncbi:5-deoxy-glucuronate isomerase [Crassaminicella profunda]|uniref:5-deoxy-glucuronate isomerase n=1 Tax=Crassaminicella profunda TaxID=1286698 RepID=UPI001CA6190F|nr:5-deoxy-glucuronate isomerase [Crassaminicella profunda]QZY54671.1 5-deoxy-glucuronate isomerase [Crassaminicella profunda]
MKFQQKDGFKPGYNDIVDIDGEYKDYLMDFGILRLEKGQEEVSKEEKERAFLLIKGEVTFEWEGNKETIKRESFIENNPWCLHVPKDVEVKITGVADDTEISVHKTRNDIVFPSKLYTENDCRIEVRGKGLMNEVGTRIVKTILDKSISADSNLVLGEDVHYPGKWSGFPSHYHAQPEIYFYKFYPENGFGLLKLGEEGELLEHNDTVMIESNLVHPQVAAPGYAMYYIWVIRHLENNPYIKPIVVDQHKWLEDPKAKIWPEK